jgi:hypothetical protein
MRRVIMKWKWELCIDLLTFTLGYATIHCLKCGPLLPNDVRKEEKDSFLIVYGAMGSNQKNLYINVATSSCPGS